MPHIRVRGASTATVAALSAQTAKLADIIKTEADNFTFEKIESLFFVGGKQVPAATPFVEVLWFPREASVAKETAAFIAEFVKASEAANASSGGEGTAPPPAYVTVVFTDLSPKLYFEDGEHF